MLTMNVIGYGNNIRKGCFQVRNLSVFNPEAAKLRTQIFGSSTEKAVSTDADGKLNIAGIASAVAVTATNLDIRDLTNASDSVLAFGFDGSANQPLKTDTDGKLQIKITENVNALVIGRVFSEDSLTGMVTGDAFTAVLEKNTSQQTTYSYAVYNHGPKDADVRLEISPTGTDPLWTVNVGPLTLTPGTMGILVSTHFLRYSRVSYKSTVPGESTTIDIFYQAQI